MYNHSILCWYFYIAWTNWYKITELWTPADESLTESVFPADLGLKCGDDVQASYCAVIDFLTNVQGCLGCCWTAQQVTDGDFEGTGAKMEADWSYTRCFEPATRCLQPRIEQPAESTAMLEHKTATWSEAEDVPAIIGTQPHVRVLIQSENTLEKIAEWNWTRQSFNMSLFMFCMPAHVAHPSCKKLWKVLPQ